MPHKSRKFREILNLPFKILLNELEIPSVNEATRNRPKQETIYQLGKVPLRIIADIAEANEDNGPIFFRKKISKE